MFVFIEGVLGAGICAAGVLGVVGVAGVVGADAFMLDPLVGALGFCVCPAAIGCEGAMAGAPALLPSDVDGCVASAGPGLASEPHAASVTSSAASCGKRTRREGMCG